MIEKLEALKHMVEKNSSGDLEISKELYNLLVSEKDVINELFRSVEIRRDRSVLSVFLGDLVSEQIGKIAVSEKGMTKEMISAIRAWKKNTYYQSAHYNLQQDTSEAANSYKKILRIIRKGFDLKYYLDAFEKKPQGEVAVYDILENFYVHEFFKSMDCGNEEDVQQSFAPMTLNFMQIDCLYKQGKLSPGVEYVIFVLIQGKIMPLGVYAYDLRETFKWYPATFKKGSKLLLFNQLDILEDEKFQD